MSNSIRSLSNHKKPQCCLMKLFIASVNQEWHGQPKHCQGTNKSQAPTLGIKRRPVLWPSFRLPIIGANAFVLTVGSQVCQPWGTAYLSPSLQVWTQTLRSAPEPAGTEVGCRCFQDSQARTLSHQPQWAQCPSLSQQCQYFQSQASALRIITFPKSLFIQHHQTGATGVLLCVGPASVLAQLLRQLQPCARLLLALPRWVGLRPCLPGCHGVRGPVERQQGPATNFLRGKAELSSYFLSNPKNSLYQFTFPRLSWQGIVPESYFF